MPKFLVLIYGDEQVWDAAGPEWEQANELGHQRFRELAGEAVLFAAELGPSAGAVAIRGGADGARAVTDGPFLESKEVIGGYYYLDAVDLAAACALAAHLPEASAEHGGVEVRALR